jgi:light-regulated signal transduction histidine kinase (bacteriophytochrome)
VSYGIMQEHAGKMHVESKVGAGTTFRLEFPMPGAARAASIPRTDTEKTTDSSAVPV